MKFETWAILVITLRLYLQNNCNNTCIKINTIFATQTNLNHHWKTWDVPFQYHQILSCLQQQTWWTRHGLGKDPSYQKQKLWKNFRVIFASLIRIKNCYTHGKVMWAILGEVMLTKARLDLFHTRAWSCYGGNCGIHARKEAQQYNDMAFMWPSLSEHYLT